MDLKLELTAYVQMIKGIEAEVGENTQTVDIMDWLTRTALELIAQGGLGVQMDTLTEPTPNPFADSMKLIL